MSTSHRAATELSGGITQTQARTNVAMCSGGLLYRGINNLLRSDEAEIVEGIAHFVISQHRGLRILAFLAERSRNSAVPGVIALIGWLRSFFSVDSPKSRGAVVWISRLSNERRSIEPMLHIAPDLDWTELRFRLLPEAAALRAATENFAPRRLFRLVRRLHGRYEFFKVLRVVEFIAYYSRYRQIFRQSPFSLAVMSSHSNPHGIAFNLAARGSGTPVVLITHGMPIRPVARLSYDLAIVHCEAARRIYIDEGCQMNRVFNHGRRQDYAPMPNERLPKSLVVGIFLCKDVNETTLRTLVSQLMNQLEVSRILIRPHPNNLWLGLNDWVASQNDPRVRLSSNASVFRDVQASDIVLAGNSSVLVDAVTAGRPSGYVAELDHGPRDVHLLVKCGLIYSVDHQYGDFKRNANAMWQFYQRPDWINVLRLFANIDEDETSVTAQALAAMRELATQRGRH